MKANLNRRQFLRTAGAAASVTVLGPTLFDFGALLAAPTFVRRNVGSMDASDPVILSYRKAINAMRALPTNDPRNWAYQAAIHGSTTMPAQTAWNSCEHGTYFFWSWHRMYLYWFERIVRKMCGDDCWALPYWNWTAPNQRQLPPMFRDATSELYTPYRNPAMNDGSGSLPAGDVDYGAAFAFGDFTDASSSLEGTPHAAIHGDVGGWMSSVRTAAQDPIFYLHHCNIDRLWNLWLAQGGGRSDPLGDATWTKTQFTFFDENGTQVQMTGCDVLRAAGQLHYAYEGEPAQVNEFCLRVRWPHIVAQREILVHLPIPETILTAEPVSFPIDIEPLRQRLAALARSKKERLLLELDDVETEKPPGAVWEVYVGLPPNAAADTASPHYVGNVALFGGGVRSESHHEFKPAHFAFAIGRALRNALKENAKQVLVTFKPHGILIHGKPSRPEVQSPVHIGRASLTVEREERR